MLGGLLVLGILLRVGRDFGLDAVTANMPDLVLLDLRLPDLHGLEVLKKLKEDDPDLQVIIMTAFAPPEIIGIAYDSGGVTTSTITVPLVTALGVGLPSSIKGRNPAIDGFGLRDHSWGPRYWQAIHQYDWLTMNFGPDFHAMVSIIRWDEERQRRWGVVVRGEEIDRALAVVSEQVHRLRALAPKNMLSGRRQAS